MNLPHDFTELPLISFRQWLLSQLFSIQTWESGVWEGLGDREVSPGPGRGRGGHSKG